MPTPGAPAGIDRRTFARPNSFIGRLFGEADLLAVGEAYPAATDFHGRRPRKLA